MSAAPDESLVTALASALRANYQALRAAHPDHRLYAFGLYITRDALFIGPTAASEEGLRGRDDPESYRWRLSSSPLHLFEEDTFDPVQTLLASRPDPYELDEDEMAAEVGTRLESCFAALETLDREGLFGAGTDRDGLVVSIFSADESDRLRLDHAKRLNPPTALAVLEPALAIREPVGDPQLLGEHQTYQVASLDYRDGVLVAAATSGELYGWRVTPEGFEELFCLKDEDEHWAVLLEEGSVLYGSTGGIRRRALDALEEPAVVLEREAKVMARLEHPGIVRVDFAGEDSGRHWLRMELMKGREVAGHRVVTLEEYVAAKGGRLPEKEVKALLESLLDALGHAHEKGLVHRDLKPANVLFDGDKVKIVFKQNPLSFHKDAKPAAAASLAAHEQGKFWEMHDKLFANQKALKKADLEKYAGELGLDMEKYKAALGDKAIGDFVDQNRAMANAVGATGTPAFFINGTPLKGAQPFPKFKEAIDKEIAAADAAGKKGTAWLKERLKANNADLAKYYVDGVAPPKVAPPKPRQRPVDRTVYKVDVDNDVDPIKGNKDALVTVAVFSEFQCPFCSRIKPTLAKIEETYGDKVRFVFKHNPLPFHKEAFKAAEASMCAKDQGRFWEMHDRLFDDQEALTPTHLMDHAESLGLNMERFQRCLDTQTHMDKVERHMEQAAKVMARGTPNTFINGRKLAGAKPLEQFTSVIDEEFQKAKDLVSKGTAPGDLYREIILDHYRNPRNRGELEVPPATLAEGFNPLCGDEIRVYLQVDGETISDMRIGGQGCSISQSSASMMSTAVVGKSVDEARDVLRQFKEMMSIHEHGLDHDEDAPANDRPGASGLGDLEALRGVVKFPVRIKCATLGWNTLDQALALSEDGSPTE